ncbi:phage tail protein [Sphingomonas sp. VDB2]|uniref:phage tail protein n=1 Tax=Sphingomonas sp. VDB2 TaxID=3228751 RepID=UPI003A7FC56A
MRKADSLRRWLTAYLPDLKTHPDRLQIYVEGGRIAARRSRSLSFVYRYTLKVGIWDFAGDPDHIMVPMLAWIEKEQRELLRRDDSDPFEFEAELLDGDVSDILISIDLTEPVLVLPRADGTGYDIEHPPEPDLTDAFAGVSASFQQAFANDEPIVP